MDQTPSVSTWKSSEHVHKGHKILVKTRQCGGKVHIWGISGDRVIKTIKSDYNSATLLLKQAMHFINSKVKN